MFSVPAEVVKTLYEYMSNTMEPDLVVGSMLRLSNINKDVHIESLILPVSKLVTNFCILFL